jgi:glycerol-3-phosphate O-acyltransferase
MHQLFFLISQSLALIFIKPFLKVKSLPQDLQLNPSQRYFFVLPKRYAADVLALKSALTEQQQTIDYRIGFLPSSTADKHFAAFMNELTAAHACDNSMVLPISIFWGRSPRKTKTLWQTWLASSWSVPGRIKRCFTVLFQSRQAHCYFSQAFSIDEQALKQPAALLTDLSKQFSKQKEAVIGPDLSHRRILAQQVLQSPSVQAFIQEQAKTNNESVASLEKKAQQYVNEMASDYSYSIVRMLDIFLSWVWEKLYQGINIKGLDNISSIAEDHELIYVPCHRSHIDYLLLSYAIYHQGLMPPHIAAGINLNLPIVGSILRRGGAFFIRRQFKDNPLYKVVLESYVKTMCQQGFSIEYFIEGGRSRTGFLLPPKPGILAMTLRASQQQTQRPLAFIPVYIGYERMLESHSYINELYGEKKQKESLTSLLSAWRFLKEDYGKVYLSIGKAITLEQMQQETSTNNAEQNELFNAVNLLGKNIQTEINHSAFVSASNFIATALLSSKRNALLEKQLKLQVNLLQQLLAFAPLSEKLHIESFDFQNALEHNIKLGLIKQNSHSLGDIYFLDQKAQVNATFLRNNTLHLFVLPSLISCILVNANKISSKRINDVCQLLYPYLKAEFFLPWNSEQLEALIKHSLAVLETQQLIQQSGGFYRAASKEDEAFHSLIVLSGACKGSIERFYIAAELMTSNDNGFYSKESLELACVQMAERLSLLHEFHAPDFFDKNLFRIFIQSLIQQNIFTEDDADKLHYNKAFLTAKKYDRYVLSPSVKNSIKQCTQ